MAAAIVAQSSRLPKVGDQIGYLDVLICFSAVLI